MTAHHTAHLDGLRVAHVYPDDAGKLELFVELWAGGRRAPELYPPFKVFEGPDDPPGRAALDRTAVLLKGLCDYVNAGGDLGVLVDTVGNFVAESPPLRPPLELVSVLPPAGGNTLVWAMPDGTFLRVVEGEDGFTEVLTAAELQLSDADDALPFTDGPPPRGG